MSSTVQHLVVPRTTSYTGVSTPPPVLPTYFLRLLERPVVIVDARARLEAIRSPEETPIRAA